MLAPDDYTLRPLTADDEAILWDLLYFGIKRSEGTEPPREIVQRPEYARYVEGWGGPDDLGFVAHDKSAGGLLGAVWMRAPFAQDAPPELAFVVKPGFRHHGIGASLLTQMMRANSHLSAVALRMSATSPAVRLFERFGFVIENENEQAVVMHRAI
ncbi:MAG: GNAT family N-acetyltransferase [Spartobacteria bacterium]